MKDSQFFRAGVGTVIYTTTGEIILFERADMVDVWQLQQGGIDADETPAETLWRELAEETGLTKHDVTLTHEYPNWLYYEYTPTIRNTLHTTNTRGQIHRWYFLQLQQNVTIDLNQATDNEFTNYKIGHFTDLTESTLPHNQLKRAVYQSLATYYQDTVFPI